MLPNVVREHLQLRSGDHVKFFIRPDGGVTLLRKLPVKAIRGIVKSRRRVVTLLEMEATIAKSAAIARST